MKVDQFLIFFQTTTGKIKMVLDKFNIQWSNTCKSKDYLFVGNIAKYTKTWLCGSSVPSDFKSLKSKKKEIIIKFHSDGSGRKSGFKARFIGNTSAFIYIYYIF